jgi:DNA ligase-1
MDGEIMVTSDGLNEDFNTVQSMLMREDGQPAFRFYAFDYVESSIHKPYSDRIGDLIAWVSKNRKKFPFEDAVVPLIPVSVKDSVQLLDQKGKFEALGYEGIMIRRPDGMYKCGRSSVKQGILIKYKSFSDAEAEVIGFEEKMHNDNPAEEDAFGNTKRSSHKENLVPAGTLGALILEMPNGIQFKIGTGFDDAEKQNIWDRKAKYKGKLVKYRYQELGPNGKPRFPSFIGFRHELDT